MDARMAFDASGSTDICKPAIEKIRLDSKAGKLTPLQDIAGLLPPPKAPDAKDGSDPLHGLLEEIEGREEYGDVKTVSAGRGSLYFYSATFMTPSYAQIASLVEEGEACSTIVSTVRNESCVYPRPTSIELFLAPPFGMSSDEIRDRTSQIMQNDQYADIKSIQCSTGAVYLFSELYMGREMAELYAEDREHGPENQ